MRFKKIIIWLCVLGLTIILGACSVKDAVTPCYIPPEVIKSIGAKLPLIPWIPYTSLFDAKYVKAKLYSQYLLYDGLLTGSMRISEDFQQMVFSPTGPIGLLIPTLTAGTLGAVLISKPDDKRKIIELENGNAKNSK